jgi:hypothetical protein
MKKLVLLSLVSLVTMALWATEPTYKVVHKGKATAKLDFSRYSRNNKPKNLRSGSLLTVPIGKAGNLLSVDDGLCHQIDVDSAMNTVLFVHRSDTVFGTSFNVAQYRYDISRNGGTTWTTNIGPLNPIADNITINGRFPQAVLRPDSAYPTNPDSAWIVYNGSWHNGGTTDRWQGQFYGVGRLDGDTTTYTQHDEVVNNQNVEIATSMIESAPGNYWNLNLNYTALTTSTDTIRGLIIEHGLWNDSAGEVLWTYQYITINSGSITNTSSTVIGNNLGSPSISFDPTGKYGWIVMIGSLTNGPNYATVPIYLQSSDYGQSWSTPQALYLGNLPGLFSIPSGGAVATLGLSIVEDAPVVVDSAGNPHIFAVVGTTDTTSSQGDIYLDLLVLYDIYYNPAVVGCSWQANFLAQVWGFEGDYTSDAVTEVNRVQASRSKDGTKIFVFWNDTDSADVAAILSSATSGATIYSNPYPNLYGIGIDMTSRQTTDAINYTAGNALFGGQMLVPSSAAGTIGGAMFPVVSPNALNQGNGNYNVPVVLTDPDYLQPVITSKSSINPASFYYCQNINYNTSQYVNKFDNAPPTLTVNGLDTVYILLGQPYTPPTATAFDCVYGNITPHYSSTVPTNGSGNTDSAGVFTSTWTATNPLGNSSSATQTVIVSGPPTAIIWDSITTADYIFLFKDVSLNFPTSREWFWGDGTYNNTNITQVTKHYTTDGTKMVILNVSNQYGHSSDTVYIDVEKVGINNITISNKITLYPNPSSGMMTIEMTDDIAKGAKVSVFNIIGEQVSQTIEIKPNVTNTAVNYNNLDAGAYMMKIETPAGTAIKQFTINK